MKVEVVKRQNNKNDTEEKKTIGQLFDLLQFILYRDWPADVNVYCANNCHWKMLNYQSPWLTSHR